MNVRRKFVLFVLLGITVAASVKADGLYTTRDFINPPMAWRPVPLWFWNNAAVEGSQLESELRNMIEQDRYGGCAILPFGENFRPGYLSEHGSNQWEWSDHVHEQSSWQDNQTFG